MKSRAILLYFILVTLRQSIGDFFSETFSSLLTCMNIDDSVLTTTDGITYGTSLVIQDLDHCVLKKDKTLCDNAMKSFTTSQDETLPGKLYSTLMAPSSTSVPNSCLCSASYRDILDTSASELLQTMFSYCDTFFGAQLSSSGSTVQDCSKALLLSCNSSTESYASMISCIEDSYSTLPNQCSLFLGATFNYVYDTCSDDISLYCPNVNANFAKDCLVQHTTNLSSKCAAELQEVIGGYTPCSKEADSLCSDQRTLAGMMSCLQTKADSALDQACSNVIAGLGQCTSEVPSPDLPFFIPSFGLDMRPGGGQSLDASDDDDNLLLGGSDRDGDQRPSTLIVEPLPSQGKTSPFDRSHTKPGPGSINVKTNPEKPSHSSSVKSKIGPMRALLPGTSSALTTGSTVSTGTSAEDSRKAVMLGRSAPQHARASERVRVRERKLAPGPGPEPNLAKAKAVPCWSLSAPRLGVLDNLKDGPKTRPDLVPKVGPNTAKGSPNTAKEGPKNGPVPPALDPKDGLGAGLGPEAGPKDGPETGLGPEAGPNDGSQPSTDDDKEDGASAGDKDNEGDFLGGISTPRSKTLGVNDDGPRVTAMTVRNDLKMVSYASGAIGVSLLVFGLLVVAVFTSGWHRRFLSQENGSPPNSWDFDYKRARTTSFSSLLWHDEESSSTHPLAVAEVEIAQVVVIADEK